MLTKLISLPKSEFVSKFRNSIQEDRGSVIIAENAGSLSNSDIISVYNSSGKAIVICDRIGRFDCNIIMWGINILRMFTLYRKVSKQSDGLLVTISVTSSYAEVNICEEEWYNCIEELL